MGVTRRQQPRLPITKSVAAWTIGEFFLFFKKYILYFRRIKQELMEPSVLFSYLAEYWAWKKNGGSKAAVWIYVDQVSVMLAFMFVFGMTWGGAMPICATWRSIVVV